MIFPVSVNTTNAEGTESLGKKLAGALCYDESLPRFIALYGDLGAGKTAFVRGFVSEIAPSARVKSPTFALVHEYTAFPAPVFHFDMYRIGSEDELYSTGFYDYLSRRSFILAEWSENIPYALPDRYIEVRIVKDNKAAPDSRRITINLAESKETQK
jgi:tRNA threonylcarbamoyladenosine biosynthesis protein TsaE